MDSIRPTTQRNRILAPAARLNFSSSTSSSSSPKCCRWCRRRRRRHTPRWLSMVNDASVVTVLVITIAMFYYAPHVLSWTLSVPTRCRGHEKNQGRYFQSTIIGTSNSMPPAASSSSIITKVSLLSAMATNDDNDELTNTSEENDGDNDDDNNIDNEVENEAEIMDIANALIQTSSPPIIVNSDEQSSNGNENYDIDVVETFMNKANAAWKDGLSEGNTAVLRSTQWEGNDSGAEAAVEEEEEAPPMNNYPYFTTMSNANNLQETNIGNDAVGGDDTDYIGSIQGSNESQPLNNSPSNVAVLKGETKIPPTLGTSVIQASGADKRTLFPYSKGTPRSSAGTNLTKDNGITGATLAQPWKSPLKGVASKGLFQPSLNIGTDFDASGSTTAVGETLIGKESTPSSVSAMPVSSLKGVMVGSANQSQNMFGPMKKSVESLNKGVFGAMKAKTGNIMFPLPKMDVLKKGVGGGELKSTRTVFPPPPQTLKGTQLSDSNAENESSFVEQSVNPVGAATMPQREGGSLLNKSPLPKIGQIDKQVVIKTAKSGGLGGGTLPFMKKSPFTASPSEGVEVSSINTKGSGNFPIPLKGEGVASIGKGSPPSQLKSPINGDAPRPEMKDTTTTTTTFPPRLKTPLKGVVVGTTKFTDKLGPIKKSPGSMNEEGTSAMKAESGTAVFPLLKMGSLKKGVGVGDLKSTRSVFSPSPQALKGTQLSDLNNEEEPSLGEQSINPVDAAAMPPGGDGSLRVFPPSPQAIKGTQTPFVERSINSVGAASMPQREGGSLLKKSLLPKIGQINKQAVMNTPKSGGLGGGTLPFMKKSPFSVSPSKGVEVSSFNTKGSGNFPISLKGEGVAPIAKGSPPLQLKSPINDDAPLLPGKVMPSDGAIKDATMASSPSPVAPLKGSLFGATKSSDTLGPGKVGLGGIKAKNDTTTTFPMPSVDEVKKGLIFGELKSKSTIIPPPPESIKGTVLEQTFNSGKTMISTPGDSGMFGTKSLLPKISQIDKSVVGTTKSGGTLPFMKKSPFTTSPSKSVELSSFSAKGKGIFPSQLKGLSPSSLKTPINKDAPRLEESSDDIMTSPFPNAPLKGSVFGATNSPNTDGNTSAGSLNKGGFIGMNMLRKKSENSPTDDVSLVQNRALDKQIIKVGEDLTAIDRDEDADGDVLDAVVEDFEDEVDGNILSISYPRTSDPFLVEGRTPPPKVMGTGGSFTPKAFTPPKVRPVPKTLDIVDGFIDLDSWKDESNQLNDPARQAKQPKNIWTGESFYGTASSRVYGLGAENVDVKRRGDTKTPIGEGNEPVTQQTNKEDIGTDKRGVRQKLSVEEMGLMREKERVASLLADAERKIAEQLDKLEEERREARAILENTAREKADVEKRASKLEATLMKDVRFLERRLADEVATAKQKLKEEQDQRDAERDRLRAADEARWNKMLNIEEKMGEKRIKVEADELSDKINHILETKLAERLAELMKEKNNGQITMSSFRSNGNIPQTLETDDAEKMQLPRSESTSHGANTKDHVNDSLAADVKELDIVSMSFDPTKSPHLASISLDENAEIGSYPTEYPFVSLLRDSSPYIVNHRHSTIVYHIPGDLISNQARFNSVMDDISLTYLFGMKIVICVGCRKQILQRLENLPGRTAAGVDQYSKVGVRVTDAETLRIVEEEAGFCRFEVERLLNRCLRNKGADCNVVSGCFITAMKYGIIDGVNYQHTGYPTTLQTDQIQMFLARNDVVLLTPLGFSTSGNALNIHSEALAAFTAGALEASKLVYFATNPMILRGGTDANRKQRIQMITKGNALQILSHHGLHVNSETGFPHWKNTLTLDNKLDRDQQSMLLKMGWASMAIERGVERAHIIDSEDGALLEELFTARRGFGTCISQDDYEAPHPEDWNDDFSVADGVSSGGLVEW